MSKLFIAGEAIRFTGLVYFTGGPLWACIMTFVIIFEACAVSYNLVLGKVTVKESAQDDEEDSAGESPTTLFPG